MDGMHVYVSNYVVKTINNFEMWFNLVVFPLSSAGVSYRPSFRPVFVVYFPDFRRV